MYRLSRVARQHEGPNTPVHTRKLRIRVDWFSRAARKFESPNAIRSKQSYEDLVASRAVERKQTDRQIERNRARDRYRDRQTESDRGEPLPLAGAVAAAAGNRLSGV